MLKKILSIVSVLFVTGTITVSANVAVNIPAIEYSNEDYTFRIKGSNQEFVLLDEGTTNDSKFLVMAKGYYGKTVYHSGGGSKFDPDNPQSMAYFLNNDFLKDGNRSTFTLRYYKLPQNIIDHIDKNHIWECERGKSGSDADKPYKIKCGVVIPSQTELIKYADKIGWDDDYASRENDVSIAPWVLRSMYDHGELMAVRPTISMTKVSTYGANVAVGIRPVFWLDIDFFRDVELDLDTMGNEVAEVFKKYYTIDELTDIYSLQECYDYFGYSSPFSMSANEGNLIIVKNNRNEDENALMLTIYYDEGGYPITQKYVPIYVKANSELNIAIDTSCNDGVYSIVKIIQRKMPYTVLSNSICFKEVK